MDGFKRNENGKFTEGTAPGPGRPKGQSLKEFWRARFAEMSEEERIEFTQKVGNEVIWKMAEGNPANATDLTSAGKPIIMLAPEIIDKNALDQSPEHDSEG